MYISEIDVDMEEDDESQHYRRKNSPGKMLKNNGAETVYEKEITVTQHKLMMRAKRKDLKSATARNCYDKVIA